MTTKFTVWAIVSIAIVFSALPSASAMAAIIPPPLPSPALGFKIDSVSVSPQSLSIPCGVFSCPGFRGTKSFSATVGYTASYDGALFDPTDTLSLGARNFNIALLEDDVAFDDIVGLFAGSSSYSRTFRKSYSGSFSLGFTVGASQLNRQCQGGCNTRSGAIAEAFALEFLIDPSSYVDIAFRPSFGPTLEGRVNLSPGAQLRLNDLHRVPEPSSLALFAAGVFALCCLRWRSGHRLASNRVLARFGVRPFRPPVACS
ncbi:PEP-CTERM sorting domain-containing protein [Niveibacterium sp. 24ML]|uniref:PEP-CTERM sorting domain-containing protein n=1 Tax=Niveibacterium sp. 24ML TaxID=2985512 RepID=UPI002271C8CA|nr:PEP-CTERM sorting domain-containing protein [Niveibacterium sp. 24ML]MCX9157123.1 PEP-CTERM sorting domain-containing protein [Niveibacterium sp. 24ML]